MSELFSHLLQRHQGAVPLVKPRLTSRFETTGVTLAAAISPLYNEEPRPVEAAERFPLQPASPPGPAIPPFEEEPGPTVLPATGEGLQDTTAAGHPNLPGADVAPHPQPKHTAAEPVSSKEAPSQQPQEQLSKSFDQDRHPRPEVDTEAVMQPTQAPNEIRPRFATLIARSAETPVEMPARRAAAAGKTQDASHPPDLLTGPVTVTAQPAVEPPEIRPLMTRPKPMADPERPLSTMPPQDYPQVPAPTNPAPDAPAGQRPVVFDQATLTIEGEDGPRAREHLLVPPDWLARMQRDYQRDWDVRMRRAKSEPSINVTIGRVEVRAEAPPAPPKPRARKNASPVMSLDEYLSQRKGRG